MYEDPLKISMKRSDSFIERWARDKSEVIETDTG